MKKIIEANLEELFNLKLECIDGSIESTYTKILIAYLTEDSTQLEIELALMDQSIEVYELSKLRLNILNKTINLSKLEEFLTYANALVPYSLIQGEAYFLLGLSYCNLKEYENSKKYYLMAQNILMINGLLKKAVKSLFNFVVSESRLNNEKKLILDYKFIAKKAAKINDPIVEGLCYMNIAQEYYSANAFELSLKYIHQAVLCLESDSGVNHYYYALLQRCQTLLMLNRHSDALCDYQILNYSNLDDIKDALKVIDTTLGSKECQNIAKRLGPTWAGKFKNLSNHNPKKKLTSKESVVIELLCEKSLSLDELALELYGEQIDYYSAQNRMKVLLSRFRKKSPDLIYFAEGQYHINDEQVLLIS